MQELTDPTQPLAALRVLDFGQYLAGPAVALLLADQGADVLHIDPPGGARWESNATALLNRGKRSVVLDLKQRADVSAAKELVATADVLVENFRPRVMNRLGLGPEQTTRLNPRLVYLSLPGFSALDADHAGIQAWEGTVGASLGIYSDMGLSRRLRGLVPSYTPIPVASAYAAAFGALAVMIALHNRERTGCGDVIEVPLSLAVLDALALNNMTIHGLPSRHLAPQEVELQARLEAGLPLDLRYEQVCALLDPFWANYLCKDSRPFYVVAPGHRSHVMRLLQTLGLWTQLLREGLPTEDPYKPRSQRAKPDEGSVFAYPLLKPWSTRIRELLAARLQGRTAFEWEAVFEERGIPGAAQQTTKEWLWSEHARRSALVVDVDDAEHGRMLQSGAAVWLKRGRRTHAEPRSRSKVSEEPERLSHEMRLAPPATHTDVDSGEHRNDLPLSGVRILDLTNVIAGPCVSGFLRRFGATVIKVNKPRPDFDPSMTYLLAVYADRGKRSILLDLKRPESQPVMERLLANVDVVVFNGTDRQQQELRLDPASLARINPRLIFARVSAFGGPRQGLRDGQLGYDNCMQAATGIMARFGGSLQTPEEYAEIGAIDVLAGVLGAFAVMLAIRQRERRDEAVTAETSLAAAAQFLQLPFMWDHEGRPPFDEPSGPHAKGEHALYRLYPTSDGWLFIGLRRQQVRELCELPDFADMEPLQPGLLGNGPSSARGDDAETLDEALAAALAKRFMRRSADEWAARLQSVGIGAVAVSTMARTRDEHLVPLDEEPSLESGKPLYLRDEHHPSGHVIDLAAPNAIRFEHARSEPPLPPPSHYGSHTREVLGELGLTAQQVDRHSRRVPPVWARHTAQPGFLTDRTGSRR